MTKRISVFGATGSIGQNTLDLIRRDRSAFDVVVLTGADNIDQLIKDALDFHPDHVVIANDAHLGTLQSGLAGTGISCAAGNTALTDAATRPTDIFMSAIVGAAALASSFAALAHTKTLALANKESLVCAGPLLRATATTHGTRILPVDSEHSAIFQALIGENPDDVETVVITASGGAFRDLPDAALHDVTPEQAATHPNWDMGQRITIDSASMFNKAMELIEAKELFGLSPDQLKVSIHPQSLVHALVGFRDGAFMAHVGPPDMRHAIGFALNYPDRKHLPVQRLDWLQAMTLDFKPACFDRYPALRLAHDVMAKSGRWGAVFNAAKEIALDRFIARDISFLGMAQLVEMTLNTMDQSGDLSDTIQNLDDVLECDLCARGVAQQMKIG